MGDGIDEPFEIERRGAAAGINPMFGEWQQQFELAPVSYANGGNARAAFKTAVSLAHMEGRIPGRAYPDNVGYRVNLPNRESFSPDASFYVGNSAGMRFLEGAPVFAVEVRSENDYGPEAERAMARKRADYFAAGTLIVWDVDLLSIDTIKSYGRDDPNNPKIFRRGDLADAEPTVPGWRIAVDELFS